MEARLYLFLIWENFLLFYSFIQRRTQRWVDELLMNLVPSDLGEEGMLLYFIKAAESKGFINLKRFSATDQNIIFLPFHLEV